MFYVIHYLRIQNHCCCSTFHPPSSCVENVPSCVVSMGTVRREGLVRFNQCPYFKLNIPIYIVCMLIHLALSICILMAHTENCLLLLCSMCTFGHILRPMITSPVLLRLCCPCWLILKKALHLPMCKHNITATVHATSVQGTTASCLWFQYSIMQSHWFVPLCHHNKMHIHVLLHVQWHGHRHLQRQDYIALVHVHVRCVLTFHSVT